MVVIHVDDADDADERANTAANAPTTKLVPGELAERIVVFFFGYFFPSFLLVSNYLWALLRWCRLPDTDTPVRGYLLFTGNFLLLFSLSLSLSFF